MADKANELSHDEKIARIAKLITDIEWIRAQEKKWPWSRFDLGRREIVMLFSGSADDAVEWLVRQIALEASIGKPRLRCDCQACIDYRNKVVP